MVTSILGCENKVGTWASQGIRGINAWRYLDGLTCSDLHPFERAAAAGGSGTDGRGVGQSDATTAGPATHLAHDDGGVLSRPFLFCMGDSQQPLAPPWG